MTVETLIVIPARYASTRFPGKPLADVAGMTMLARTGRQAGAAAARLENAAFVVATDDERIAKHCETINALSVMTDPDLPSGSDRALAAALKIAPDCRYIVNLQGDAPLTPVRHLTAIVRTLRERKADAATPCVRLSWDELDQFRRDKIETPHSGTTCLVGEDNHALWFSKSVLPAIRKESERRKTEDKSPVLRHIGLYGFRRDSLERFAALAPSRYEKIEGLEQLRMLENGMTIACVEVEASPLSSSGIDTPADLERLNALIAAHGEPGVVE
ncbi:MAG: 3-deoxy-manno-octulosonate cytidylyltransferase [Pseudomonadota bacterium]